MDLMRDESPFLQQVSIDEAFLDVTPTRVNRESPVSIARRLQREVKDLGITCSIGVGVSKAVAKTASEENKPRGLTVVYPGEEEAFLSDLPIARMSGIGPVAQASLKRYGVKTLGDVAHADDDVLHAVFGINADVMRARCMGKDADLIERDEKAKSISNEMSFAKNLSDERDVIAAIDTVCDKVARRMRKNHVLANHVTLKIRYANLQSRTAALTLHDATESEFDLQKAAKKLLPNLWHPGVEIRLVGIAVSHFTNANDPIQPSLFSMDGTLSEDDQDDVGVTATHAQQEKLSQATDRVRDRFGEQAVQFGHQIRTNENTTGSASKNPSDYKKV